MESWHPVLVHFPIAFLPLSIVFDIVGLWGKQLYWQLVAYVLLILGTVTALFAVLSGNQAAIIYREQAVNKQITDHENLSTLAFFLFLIIVLGRLPLHLQNRLGTLVLKGWIFLACLASAFLWWSAFLGGLLVYRYGVGVQGKF